MGIADKDILPMLQDIKQAADEGGYVDKEMPSWEPKLDKAAEEFPPEDLPTYLTKKDLKEDISRVAAMEQTRKGRKKLGRIVNGHKDKVINNLDRAAGKAPAGKFRLEEPLSEPKTMINNGTWKDEASTGRDFFTEQPSEDLKRNYATGRDFFTEQPSEDLKRNYSDWNERENMSTTQYRPRQEEERPRPRGEEERPSPRQEEERPRTSLDRDNKRGTRNTPDQTREERYGSMDNREKERGTRNTAGQTRERYGTMEPREMDTIEERMTRHEREPTNRPRTSSDRQNIEPTKRPRSS